MSENKALIIWTRKNKSSRCFDKCMRIYLIKTLLILQFIFTIIYSSENYQNQFRSSLSSVSFLHAVSSNPALLVSAGYPTFAMQLPIPVSMTLQISNSILTLPNPVDYFLHFDKIDQWIARMLIESFQLDGLSPKEVSARISSFADNDIKLWMYVEIPYLKIAHKNDSTYCNGWGFNIYSFIDGYINVPGKIFTLVFSTDKGLQPGNLISFETLSAYSEFVTEIRSAWGHAYKISINYKNRELFNRAQIGFGFAQRLGHAFYSLNADTLMLDYKKRGVMNVRGDLDIVTSGIGNNGSVKGLNINGYGVEVSGGAVLQNDYVSISGSLSKIGVMGWFKNKYSTNVHVARDSVYLYDLFEKNNDTLIAVKNNVPENIRYGLSPVLSGLISTRIPVKERLHALSSYQLFSLGCQLSSVDIGRFGRGCALSFDIENGIDYGKIPLRVGWTYAQDRNVSSTISLELLNRYLTYDVWYRATGDLLFRARKGMEIGFCFHVFTGFKPFKK
jgi:hypothetical protein